MHPCGKAPKKPNKESTGPNIPARWNGDKRGGGLPVASWNEKRKKKESFLLSMDQHFHDAVRRCLTICSGCCRIQECTGQVVWSGGTCCTRLEGWRRNHPAHPPIHTFFQREKNLVREPKIAHTFLEDVLINVTVTVWAFERSQTERTVKRMAVPALWDLCTNRQKAPQQRRVDRQLQYTACPWETRPCETQ